MFFKNFQKINTIKFSIFILLLSLNLDQAHTFAVEKKSFCLKNWVQKNRISSGEVATAPKLKLKKRRYKTTKMLDQYRGEDKGESYIMGRGVKIKYFTPEEQKAFKVTFNESGLFVKDGKKIDTGMSQTMFVMKSDGSIYTSPPIKKKPGAMNHSSLAEGKPIACAGNIKIQNGKLIYIDNDSGHYAPKPEFLVQVLEELKRQGVSLSRVSGFINTSGIPRSNRTKYMRKILERIRNLGADPRKFSW